VNDEITTPDRELLVLSSSLGMTVSTRSLAMLADALCHRRTQLRTRWRRLDVGRQALLVVAVPAPQREVVHTQHGRNRH
jgi:hypothetical protein